MPHEISVGLDYLVSVGIDVVNHDLVQQSHIVDGTLVLDFKSLKANPDFSKLISLEWTNQLILLIISLATVAGHDTLKTKTVLIDLQNT